MSDTMFNREDLKHLLSEYQKSIIQSEAEVRSKFIVPLLNFLQYPTELRSEEFPVYGFEGGKRLPTKNADFIMFSDKEFKTHRKFTQSAIDWVKNHSLLVFEAKKPGEMPSVVGQPVYYTVWTKAVAYLISDGEYIKGYYYNVLAADWVVLDCKVLDLADCPDIWAFSYDNILSIKEHGYAESKDINKLRNAVEGTEDDYIELTSGEDINLPESTYAYMRQALGKNAEGLGPLALVVKFLNMTDSYLKNEMRYDIPPYMFEFPRAKYEALLYTDELIFPVMKGSVLVFYWNEFEKYSFENEYIWIDVIYADAKLVNLTLGYHVLNRQVAERLANFLLVKKCITANTIRIQVNDPECRNLFLPINDLDPLAWMQSNKERLNSITDYWVEGLEKMRIIEEYYGFVFDLRPVNDPETLNEIYDAVDFVYAGIAMECNCSILVQGGGFEEDIEIDEPTMYQEDDQIQLNCKVIFGVTFKPYRTTLLPGTVHVASSTTADIIEIAASCFYKLVSMGESI